MSLKQRLWDAGYAMAEPFIKTPRSDKAVVAVALAEILYIRTAVWFGIPDGMCDPYHKVADARE